MTRAISNVDTDFLEELSAVANTQEDLCLLLAEKVDTPEMMELVRELLVRANKIKLMVNDQRKFLKGNLTLKTVSPQE
ncbi:MAG: hypothetical protein DPW09_24850 [Anaerolineae bacterium]|nr:hypothetical protein [Anaerolineales bacterium]MCQ3976674.1 hypothetical protein [Anaerolineae bacterium]